jgi:hypothetical protein
MRCTFLGQVDRAEPHREGPREVARHLGRAAAKLDAELGRGFLVAGAAADGELAVLLDQVEQVSPPWSLSTSPTSAPSTCTSSRSAECLAGNWMSSRFTERGILQ